MYRKHQGRKEPNLLQLKKLVDGIHKKIENEDNMNLLRFLKNII